MRNKIVAGLILATGVLFTTAVFLASEDYIYARDKLVLLAFVTGMSAIFTRVLIKE